MPIIQEYIVSSFFGCWGFKILLTPSTYWYQKDVENDVIFIGIQSYFSALTYYS